jgi:hypothetical protein
MNEKHFFVMHEGKAFVGTEQAIPGSTQKKISFTSFANLLQWYANETNNGKNIATIWMNSPLRRQYNALVFDPTYTGNPNATKEDPRPFNLYQGFAVEPRPGSCVLWKKHLLEVGCNEDEDLFTYVMDWFAHMVQRPGDKRSGVAIVWKGPKGTGKGTINSPFLQLWGVHGLHLQGPEQLLSHFNSALANKVFIFGDEALLTGNKRAEGKLKGLITEDTTLLEQKYMDPIVIANHMRFTFASNEHSVLPATVDERRFLVIDVPPTRARDYTYFQDIYNELESGGTEALLAELLERKITSNLRDAPKTLGLWNEVISSFPPEDMFFYEQLKEGVLIKEEPTDIMKSLFYHRYKDFCKVQRVTPVTLGTFTSTVKRLCPCVGERKLRVDPGKEKRTWFWSFPALAECRAAFADLSGWGEIVKW